MSVTLDIITEWIIQTVTKWSTAKVTPPPNISSFTLNLACLLSKNQDRFDVLNNIFIKLVNVVKVRQSNAAFSVKLSYIKLLSSFLEHRSGIEWMIVCTFWEDIYQMSLKDNSEEIFKESTNFLSKLLDQAFDYDENFCKNIIKRLLAPLGETIYKRKKISDSNTEEQISEEIKLTLKLIGDILQNLFEGILNKDKDFRVVLVFFKEFNDDERISDFLKVSQNDNSFNCVRIHFIIQFLELYVNAVCNGVSDATTKASIENIRKNYVAAVFRGPFLDVMELCYFGFLYWNLLIKKIPNSSDEFVIDDHLYCPFLISHYCLLIKYCVPPGDLDKEYEIDEFRDAFLQKMLKNVNKEAFRVCYFWRDYLLEQSDLFAFSVIGLNYMKEVRKYGNRTDGVFTFQTIFYNLKDFLWAIEKSPDKLEMFVNHPDYFFANLELLAILIEEYEITWKDCYEAIDVLSVCFELLMLANWSSNVIIQTLKLINIATAKFMSPNMALLLDSTTDSVINLLGPLLYSKIFDTNLDIKIAALEVVCTVGRMSRNSKSFNLIF